MKFRNAANGPRLLVSRISELPGLLMSWIWIPIVRDGTVSSKPGNVISRLAMAIPDVGSVVAINGAFEKVNAVPVAVAVAAALSVTVVPVRVVTVVPAGSPAPETPWPTTSPVAAATLRMMLLPMVTSPVVATVLRSARKSLNWNPSPGCAGGGVLELQGGIA